jgi:uncharacterized membrane protein YbhN (UPF0104 family)
MASSPGAVGVVIPTGARWRWSAKHLALTVVAGALLVWSLVSLGEPALLVAAAHEVWERPELLAVFLVSYTAAFALRALAWRMLTPDGPPVLRMFSFLQVALLVNHLLPTKAGEVVRVGLLARSGTPLGAAAASTVLARGLDFVALCAIVLVLGPLAGGQLPALAGLLTLPLLVVAVGALLAWFLVTAPVDAMSARLPPPLAALLTQTRLTLRAVPPRHVAAAFLAVVPSWVLEAGALWAVALAAGVTLSFEVVAVATAFTIAFQGFQVTPGGLGLYEASLATVLTLFGLDPATGLTLAVATHALKFAYAYLVGGLCLIAEGIVGAAPRAAPDSPETARRRIGASLNGAISKEASRRLRRGIAGVAPLVGYFAAPAAVVHLWCPVAAILLAWTAFGEAPVSLPEAPRGLLATLPLVALARHHHLPREATPALLLVPALFGLLFGIAAPWASLVAAALAGLTGLWQRRLDPLASPWAAFLVQPLVVGSAQPLPVAAFGIAALVVVVLARQWWHARRPLPPPGALPTGSTVAVVVPVHDEAPTIASVIATVPRASLRALGFDTRVVVVDDGSSDGSGSLAEEAGADVVVRHPTCRGLGAALRTGLATAQQMGAAAVVYLDADGEYDPREIPAVLAPVLRGEADYVLGSRFPDGAAVMRASRRWGNRIFTALLSLLVGRRLRDGQTGFRAFSARAVAQADIIHDYNYAQVLTLDLLRKGMRLSQVPIRYRPRRHGTSFIRYHVYLRRVVPAILREVLRP